MSFRLEPSRSRSRLSDEGERGIPLHVLLSTEGSPAYACERSMEMKTQEYSGNGSNSVQLFRGIFGRYVLAK